MELVKTIAEHVGSSNEKYFKDTLFQSKALLIGLNCLQSGQVQRPHQHDDQDKFYYVISGNGHFWLGEQRLRAKTGDLVFAPAGLNHGVENDAEEQLILLVGIAPAP